MRRPIHLARIINVRVPEELVASAEEVAQRRGMTLSTFTRDSLKRNVDAHRKNNVHETDGRQRSNRENAVSRKLMSFSEHAHWYAEEQERRHNRALRKLEDEQRAAWLRGGKRCKK